MSLSSISIKRPVLTIVMNLLIILFGLIGYKYLGVREYPSIDPPVITVRTNYSGANADVIESQISEPLEKVINGIAGIRSISSSSNQGSSVITVEFELGVELFHGCRINEFDSVLHTRWSSLARTAIAVLTSF